MPSYPNPMEQLIAQGMAQDLFEAKGLIMRGVVYQNDRQIRSPHARLKDPTPLRWRADVAVRGALASRGGAKLQMALQALAPQVRQALKGARAIDLGAGTGGFTDCLLRAGAGQVVCIELGRHQLAARIRMDKRVEAIEGADFTTYPLADLGFFDFIVADLSWTSLSNLAPHLMRLRTTPGCHALLLCKPQFELPRHLIPKGGVVVDPEAHAQAINNARAALEKTGWHVNAAFPCPVRGRAGNQEYFLHLNR